MKVPILLLVIVLLVLLAGAPAQSSAPAPAPAGEPSASPGGRPAGGNYRLSGAAGRAVFISSGADYRLQYGSAAAPADWPDQGAGCCCSYLPCLSRQLP